jgi:EmrB/QacA subfamily drug resistance transporter
MTAHHAHCDAAAAVARPQGRSDHPRAILATCILASALAFIDGSVVNVGLPAIGASLHASATALPWVVDAYLLPLSALLLLGGAMGDRWGRRRLLIVGTTLFAVASAGCAAAPDLALLTAGRILQGVGAAILMPNSLAILGDGFSGEARGRAVGTWAAVGAMAGAIGPVLGGWLIDTVGWRAIFLVNLPIAAGAVLLARRFVAERRNESDAPLDVLGALSATIGLGALTWGLTIGAGPRGWTGLAGAMVVAGAGVLGAFVLVERRARDRAMAPLRLFASRDFVGLTLLTLLVYGALGAFVVLVPYELIEAGGYSATAAGAALLPFPLAISLASPLAGGLAGKIGARLPLAAGSIVVAVGFLLAMRIGEGGGYWTTVLPAILVVSLGMAGVAAPLTTAVLASVDASHTGSASGLNSAVARTGGLVATALLSAVLAARGPSLTAAFRGAVFAGALAAFAGAVAAFTLVAAHTGAARGRGSSSPG